MSQHADENEDDQVDVAAVGEAETTPIEKQRLFLKLTVAASIYIYIYIYMYGRIPPLYIRRASGPTAC